jgi:hypothetical protein
MMDVNISLMPLRVIEKKICLRVRGFLGPSKDPRPKRCPNTWKREELKETKKFMKVGKKGGGQCNRYDGCCA